MGGVFLSFHLQPNIFLRVAGCFLNFSIFFRLLCPIFGQWVRADFDPVRSIRRKTTPKCYTLESDNNDFNYKTAEDICLEGFLGARRRESEGKFSAENYPVPNKQISEGPIL